MQKNKKNEAETLDRLGQQIIQELQLDARQSYIKISKKLHAAEGTIRNRVRHELKKGIIKLTAVVNPLKLGFDFSCVMGLEVAIDKLTDAETILAENPNVYFLSGCTGSFDIIAIVMFHNTDEYDSFIRNTVAKLPGIKRTQTFVNMRVIKSSWTHNLDVIKLLSNK